LLKLLLGKGSLALFNWYYLLQSKGVTPITLKPIQIEVLNDNLSKANQLVELMYQASIESTKAHLQIKDWHKQLERLTIRLDDMRGAFYYK
jgi:tyrosine-protein phosphatase YwqE